MPGQVHVHALVPGAGAVAFAVGQILEDRGKGARAFWPPDLGGKPGTVLQRDEDVFDHLHVVREIGPLTGSDTGHPAPPVEKTYNKNAIAQAASVMLDRWPGRSL